MKIKVKFVEMVEKTSHYEMEVNSIEEAAVLIEDLRGEDACDNKIDSMEQTVEFKAILCPNSEEELEIQII